MGNFIIPLKLNHLLNFYIDKFFYFSFLIIYKYSISFIFFNEQYS